MMNKAAIILTISIVFQIVNSATVDEAKDIYGQLGDMMHTMTGETGYLLSTFKESAFEKLNETAASIEAQIAAKHDFVLTTAAAILSNTSTSFNISNRCQNEAENFMEGFTKIAQSRAKSCIEHSNQLINTIERDTYAELWRLTSNTYSCFNRALLECEDFEGTEKCYDFFIERVRNEMTTAKNNFLANRATAVNKYLALNVPCEEMVDGMLAIYPQQVIKHVEQCVDLDVKVSMMRNC